MSQAYHSERCGPCVYGNHTGTNGTPGCSGVRCSCPCRRPEVLVAIDYDRRGDEPLRSVLVELDNAGALLAHDVDEMPHPTRPDAAPLVVHRVSFDARRIRNTEVQGLGYRAGYVAHIA